MQKRGFPIGSVYAGDTFFAGVPLQPLKPHPCVFRRIVAIDRRIVYIRADVNVRFFGHLSRSRILYGRIFDVKIGCEAVGSFFSLNTPVAFFSLQSP